MKLFERFKEWLLRDDVARLEADTAAKVRAIKQHYADHLSEMSRRCESQLSEKKIQIDRILEKYVNIDYEIESDGRTYGMLISFAPPIVRFGGLESMDMEMLASEVAGRVQHEIKTSKFVQMAHDNELNRRHTDRAKWQAKAEARRHPED